MSSYYCIIAKHLIHVSLTSHGPTQWFLSHYRLTEQSHVFMLSLQSKSLQLHSPPGSSVHGILQPRKDWVAIPRLINLPDPEIKPVSLNSPALAGRFFTTSATSKAHNIVPFHIKIQSHMYLFLPEEILSWYYFRTWTECRNIMCVFLCLISLLIFSSILTFSYQAIF